MSKVAPPNQPLEQHSEQHLLIAGYILGDLSAEEALSFDQLVKANPHFVESELAQLQQSLDLIYGEEIAPPDYLKSRTLAAVARSHVQPTSVPFSRLPLRETAALKRGFSFPRWVIGGVGLATAGLIIAMGLQNYGLRRSLQALQTPTEQPTTESLRFALAPVEDTQSGKITIVVDPTKLSAVVETQNLPPLEAGKVYALWTVVAEDAPVTKDSKNAILTAVLSADAEGDEVRQIAVPSVFRDRALIKAVAVTVEDAAAPQQHQDSPVFIQKL